MMDQIASLMQRGLISPDAAQGLVQQIANVPKPGVPNPPLEGGGAGTRIGETVPREPLLGTAEQGQRGWLGELMSKPKPQISDADKKTSRYRIMERARNPERGNAGQLEEQNQRIMDDTERLFQEAANQHGRPLKMAGKMYYPESSNIVQGNTPGHLENLRGAGTDQARFRSALDELSADKNVKNDDLKQIVKDYDAGGVVMGKTRADHLRQIEQAFVRNARFENKLK